MSDDQLLEFVTVRASNLDHEPIGTACALDVRLAVPAVVEYASVGDFRQSPQSAREMFGTVHPFQVHAESLRRRPARTREDPTEPRVDQFDVASAFVLEAEVVECEIFEGASGKAESSGEVRCDRSA